MDKETKEKLIKTGLAEEFPNDINEEFSSRSIRRQCEKLEYENIIFQFEKMVKIIIGDLEYVDLLYGKPIKLGSNDELMRDESSSIFHGLFTIDGQLIKSLRIVYHYYVDDYVDRNSCDIYNDYDYISAYVDVHHNNDIMLELVIEIENKVHFNKDKFKDLILQWIIKNVSIIELYNYIHKTFEYSSIPIEAQNRYWGYIDPILYDIQ